MPVYALNLFTIANRREYLAYLSRSGPAVEKHNGRVHAIDKYITSKAGDVRPRQVMIVVEWASQADLERFLADPELQDMHPTGKGARPIMSGTCSKSMRTFAPF